MSPWDAAIAAPEAAETAIFDGVPKNVPESRSTASNAPRYTIDELTAVTGVPSRTIRFYQASGALPPPRREGRVAYYDDQHVERLRLVAELQDRGLNLKAIRDLVNRADAGEVSVSEWLGLGDELRAPWADDEPRIVSEPELADLLGPAARPGLVAKLVRAGLLRREGSASYAIDSPTLLKMALKVDAAGIDLGDAVQAVDILRKRLGRAADELVELFAKSAKRDELEPERATRSVEILRALAGDAVRLLFAREVERALRELVQRGDALPRRRRRR
jgi:DNA-binding transcriptional MerR regulator